MNFWLHIVVLGNKIWFYYCFFMCNFRNSVQLFLREKSKQLWELQLVRYKSHLGDIRVLGWLFRNKTQSNLHLIFPDSLLYLYLLFLWYLSLTIECSSVQQYSCSSTFIEQFTTLEQSWSVSYLSVHTQVTCYSWLCSLYSLSYLVLLCMSLSSKSWFCNVLFCSMV